MPPSSAELAAEPLSEVFWAAAQEPSSAVLRAVAADTCTNAQDTTINTITANAKLGWTAERHTTDRRAEQSRAALVCGWRAIRVPPSQAVMRARISACGVAVPPPNNPRPCSSRQAEADAYASHARLVQLPAQRAALARPRASSVVEAFTDYDIDHANRIGDLSYDADPNRNPNAARRNA
jgi:hypothetical protein